MINLELLSQIAYGAVAILVAALAVYFALRLLGKIAKIAIVIIVIALIAWFLLSDHSIVQSILSLMNGVKENANQASQIATWFQK